MEYQSARQIDVLFRTGRLRELPDELSIAGIQYHNRDNIVYPIPKMLNENYKAFVVYSSTGTGKQNPNYQDLRDQGVLDEWLVLIWAITPALHILPARAVSTTAARAKPDMKTASDALAENANIIPDVVGVRFNHFNRNVEGKVDTGAHLSSLHVEKWEAVPGKDIVRFHSSLLSNNTVQAHMISQVTIQTSEGTEIRPVVELDITINGKNIPNAKFNLNDRSQMESKLLIGQNVLERGQFLVDPNKQQDHVDQMEGEEQVDWEQLQERFKDVQIDDPDIDMIYNMMLESDISFRDLARHIKTKAYEVLEETVDY